MQRCTSGGLYQKRRPSYIGVTHDFKDAQDFIEWAQVQAGYHEHKWHLDKDLLVRGNKTYNKDTCVFLPAELNSFLLQRSAARGDLPIGVTLNNCATKPFSAQIGRGSGQKGMDYIGCFSTPSGAFEAYREEKIKRARKLAERWKSLIDQRAFSALMTYDANIND